MCNTGWWICWVAGISTAGAKEGLDAWLCALLAPGCWAGAAPHLGQDDGGTCTEFQIRVVCVHGLRKLKTALTVFPISHFMRLGLAVGFPPQEPAGNPIHSNRIDIHHLTRRIA